MHAKNGIWKIHGDIWIIHGGTRIITVCSSKFYGVNSNFCCHAVTCTGTHCNFSSATLNYPNAVFCVCREKKNLKKDVNRDSHIASSPISYSFFFEEVCCLILASSQRKLREYIEFLKFDVTIKKIKNLNSSKI